MPEDTRREGSGTVVYNRKAQSARKWLFIGGPIALFLVFSLFSCIEDSKRQAALDAARRVETARIAAEQQRIREQQARERETAAQEAARQRAEAERQAREKEAAERQRRIAAANAEREAAAKAQRERIVQMERQAREAAERADKVAKEGAARAEREAKEQMLRAQQKAKEQMERAELEAKEQMERATRQAQQQANKGSGSVSVERAPLGNSTVILQPGEITTIRAPDGQCIEIAPAQTGCAIFEAERGSAAGKLELYCAEGLPPVFNNTVVNNVMGYVPLGHTWFRAIGLSCNKTLKATAATSTPYNLDIRMRRY